MYIYGLNKPRQEFKLAMDNIIRISGQAFFRS